MRKNIFGRKFGRNVNQRKALFKGLMSSLVVYGKIKTTEAKAKGIKGEVDKLVTRARKDSVLARRLLEPYLNPKALDKFLLEVVPSFKDRKSGFTKTVRLGNRLKDNSSLVLMTWTDEILVKSPTVKKNAQKTKVLAKGGSSLGRKSSEIKIEKKPSRKTTEKEKNRKPGDKK